MKVSISYFELLTTFRYLQPQGFPAKGVKSKLVNFDLASWLAVAADLGVKRMRFFADLPYFWNPTTQRPKWDEKNSNLLYLRSPGGPNKWVWGEISPGFRSRIDDLVRIGRKNQIEYMICGATQGPDYDCPFFSAMGYPDSKAYYDRANFPEYVASGAFARLKQYYSDLWGLLSPYPARFKYAECYNEGDPGMEELKEFKPHKQALSLDMPFPIPPTVNINALRNLGVKRFVFHSVFTPADATSMVMQAKQFGIAGSEIELSTDGATPWRNPNGSYRFTFMERGGHYKVKPYWNHDEPGRYSAKVNKAGVIDAHKAIRDKVADLGVAVMDFQHVLKWSQDPSWTNDAKDWVTALLS